MLLVGLVAGYFIAMALKKMIKNGNSGYIFTDTQAKRLYSTDKLALKEVIGLSGATGDVYTLIADCGLCNYFEGTCTYDENGAYSGCQFSDRWIGKDQPI